MEEEPRIKWGTLNVAQSSGRSGMQALGGTGVLPHDWESTAEVVRETPQGEDLTMILVGRDQIRGDKIRNEYFRGIVRVE